MPSITVWTRLEPRPQSPDIKRALTAQIRDPLWMLTRQWQLGEFLGADAGSPVAAEVRGRTAPLTGWRRRDTREAWTDLDPGVPIEKPLLSEPKHAPDLTAAAECGQFFEQLLEGEHLLAPILPVFRTTYPLPGPDDLPGGTVDDSTTRFLSVMAGRVVHGVALFLDLSARGVGGVMAAIPGAEVVGPTLGPVLKRFHRWVDATYGSFGTTDPSCWQADRLEYTADVASGEDGPVLAVWPGRQGELDWYSFDARGSVTPPSTATRTQRFIVPTHVRFRGMPNARWWDFENASADFGDVQADLTETGKLMTIDFMLVHGNDWFVLPYPQKAGTLSWIDALVVHDVFGGRTSIPRIDVALPLGPGPRWSLFSTSREDAPAEPAGFFVLPPSASTAVQASAEVEDVRFLRDETADMVWAVEHATANPLGDPSLGHERSQADRPRMPDPAPAIDDHAPLRYQAQTQVPIHWIPFVPVLTPDEATTGRVMLCRGAMVDYETPGNPVIHPAGRILRSQAPSYLLHEEEVPRSGVRVVRVACRARWSDGSTHLWTEWRRGAGQGEGTSGLQFDQVVPNPRPSSG